MKVEKKSNKNLNVSKLAIVISIVILVIIIAIVIVNSSKNKGLKLDEFEKIAIYNYLENDVLDVTTIYKNSGKLEYNDSQIFQAKLKQALDTYFASNSGKEVSTSEILGTIDSAYIPEYLDFHGIIVSDYEYNPEKDSFIKTPGANSNLAGIELSANNIDYSNKKTSIQKIEKTSDNKYKISFNIVDAMVDNSSVEASGEAIVIVENNNLKIESCNINE